MSRLSNRVTTLEGKMDPVEMVNMIVHTMVSKQDDGTFSEKVASAQGHGWKVERPDGETEADFWARVEAERHGGAP